MNEGMQYDQIQGQVKVTSPSKLEIRSLSTAISFAIYNWRWKLGHNI